MERQEILKTIYNRFNEDERLVKSRKGQLEYATTMYYIHSLLKKNDKIIEIGAGTGRYSIALAKEGYDVTAIELLEKNLNILKENAEGIQNIHPYQGDATDLSQFEDETFDVTLVLGPMYHLYTDKERNAAINEAIRITKTGGKIIFAFISIYGIFYCEYFAGNFKEGIQLNYNSDYTLKHEAEQVFTGYDICEFEQLFSNKKVHKLSLATTDGMLELIEQLPSFKMSDEEFEQYLDYHLHICEKRELLGGCNHLIYIVEKD